VIEPGMALRAAPHPLAIDFSSISGYRSPILTVYLENLFETQISGEPELLLLRQFGFLWTHVARTSW
jgi:hypothetical protein